MTEWKTIEKYPLYEVSTDGQIRNVKTGRVLKPYLSSSIGYYKVKLMGGKNKKGDQMYVHRLVAEAFIQNPENYQCVNHKDQDRTNNCAENLQWCSHQYNSTYKDAQQKRVASFKEHLRQDIVQYDLDGNEIARFNTVAKAAASIHGNRSSLSSILNGWNATYKGFIWKFEDKVE